jgi:CotH kinase protein/Lamin Tail Domain/Chitobiase/beta-hexosaminidase C-terminal domain/Bacterial TSP3 repeat
MGVVGRISVSVAVVLLAWASVPAMAADVDVALGSGAFPMDGSIQIPVTLVAGGGTASTLFMDVQYNPVHLEVTNVQVGAAASGAAKSLTFANVGNGRTRVIIGGFNQNTIPTGVIALIDFQVRGNLGGTRGGAPVPFTGTSPLTGVNTSAASPSAAPLTLAVADGGVSGTFPGLPSLRWWLLLAMAALVGIYGWFHIRARGWLVVLLFGLILSSPAWAAPAAGDLDSSGAVNQADLDLLTSAALGVPIVTNADLDLSGVIDAVDYQLLVSIFNGDVVDSDGDGLLDVAEINIGSGVNVVDTDGDGVNDGDEIIIGTDPNVQNVSTVIINEIMANNDTGIVDEDGDAVDWLELWNPTNSDIDLTGWSLTDDPLFSRKFVFPAGTMITAGEYKLIYVSGKVPPPGPSIHTNFRMERAGEYLALFNAADPVTPVHEFAPTFPKQKKDTSYGYLGSTAFLRYFDVPTPGAFNSVLGGAFLGFVDDLVVSIPRGFYGSGFNLDIISPTAGATIRYTTDGTEPTLANGTTYTGPITVNANAIIRAAGFLTNYLPSPAETNTYLINVPAAQKSLPVFSMVADPTESLYEPNGIMSIMGGTYVVGLFGIETWVPGPPPNIHNPSKHGVAYERPLSLEFILPADNSGFQADAGVRVSGSDFHRLRYRRDQGNIWTGPGPISTMASYNKFSFRYYFRDSYGPKDLTYPLFSFLGSTVQSFDRLVARGGHNDGFNPFIKDELVRRLHTDMGELASNGMLANLFINGEYKAYYNITERLDNDFFKSHLLTANNFDISGFVNAPGAWEIKDGDPTGADFQALMTLVDSGMDFSNNTNYQQIADKVDVDRFINYLLVQLYSGNDDWPINNWIAAKEQVNPAAKWVFYVWDSEGAFGGTIPGGELSNLSKTGIDSFPFWQGGGGAGISGENTPIANIYRALVQNATFRARFDTLAHASFGPGGALNAANITTRYNELKTKILGVEPVMQGHGFNFNTFIEDTWIANRTAVVLAALQGAGLYIP